MSDPFPYWEQVDRIKLLKREGRDDEAISLLITCAAATVADPIGVPAPWYFEQLAIILRKRKQYQDEIDVIDEYEQEMNAAISAKRALSPPTAWAAMARRREKARKLLRKQRGD